MNRPRLHSLRGRVLLVVVVTLALVSAVIGGVTVLVVRGYLVDRLDAQLVAAGGRSGAADGAGSNGSSGGGPVGADFLLVPGQAAGTLGARLANGRIDVAAVLSQAGSLQQLTTSQAARLLAVPVDGRPHDASLGALGDYRVVATTSPGGGVIVTGLPLAEVDRVTLRLVAVDAVVAAVAIALAVLVDVFVVRRTLQPLRRVAATATQVSELPLASGAVEITARIDVPDGRGEVGEVALAVNRLLDHVDTSLTARHDSEQRLRRFVADASHELRTPLAVIRGYAELSRRSTAAAADVATALRRVEAEATRMTGLVEDLLLLARLDADRELARDEVDVGQIVVEAVGDAAAAGPDHRWRPDVPDEPVLVTGDAAALHQVVANLLANARVHTPAGTRVDAVVRVAAGAVELVVRDDGPGIDPLVLPTVFERFTRSDVSRTGSGTGLGLSIVQAIVTAHGGTVAVSSVPGRTEFLLRFPLHAAAAAVSH